MVLVCWLCSRLGLVMSKEQLLVAQAIADVWCDGEAQRLIAESIADAWGIDVVEFLYFCGLEDVK